MKRICIRLQYCLNNGNNKFYDKDNSRVSHHSGKIMAEPVRAKPLFSQNGVIYEAIIRFNAHLTPSIQQCDKHIT